jgi:hypothetical protein
MEPPEQLLQMLNFAAGLPDADSSSGSSSGSSSCGQDAAAHASASAAAAAAAHQRNHQAAMQQFGGLLKQVTNAPACGAAVWGLLGRWNALQGNHLSSQEARLKQVRVLSCFQGWCRQGAVQLHEGRAWLQTPATGDAAVIVVPTSGMFCYLPCVCKLFATRQLLPH